MVTHGKQWAKDELQNVQFQPDIVSENNLQTAKLKEIGFRQMLILHHYRQTIYLRTFCFRRSVMGDCFRRTGSDTDTRPFGFFRAIAQVAY